MQNEAKGMALGLVGVCAFGLTLPATSVVVVFLDPVFIGLGRAVVAALAAIMLLLWFKQKVPNLNQIKQLVWVSLGVVVGFPLFSSWAMETVPASHGGVVLGILPIATAVMGVLISNERPSIGFWIVSAIGGALVVLYALLQGSGSFQMADIALLAAILSAATGYAIGAKLSKEMGGWQVICWALVLALPFILVPALYSIPESFANISIKGYLSFFYLALVSQLLAFFVWYRGLALGGVARVSQAQLLQPFITLVVSVILLGETIDSQTYVFIFLVVCSVWISKKMPILEKSEQQRLVSES